MGRIWRPGDRISAALGLSVASEKLEIPTGHVSPKSIVTETEEIPTYILTSQSQKGDASQSEGMSLTPLTVLLSPGLDCVVVYLKQDKGSLCVRGEPKGKFRFHLEKSKTIELQDIPIMSDINNRY